MENYVNHIISKSTLWYTAVAPTTWCLALRVYVYSSIIPGTMYSANEEMCVPHDVYLWYNQLPFDGRTRHNFCGTSGLREEVLRV